MLDGGPSNPFKGFWPAGGGDRVVTLQELMATLAGLVWALLWWWVGRVFGAGWCRRFVAGGMAGMLLG